VSDSLIPCLTDVLRARQTIAPYLRPTPLYRYQGLCDLLGAEAYVKHENHQPIGAFKLRGGVNLMANLSDQQRALGVMTASSGNHGQSVAYAARLFGVQATICLPRDANPAKVAGIQAQGAEIVYHGVDFDETFPYSIELAKERGCRYIHPLNEPLLVAGVATSTLEILESLPEVDVIIVPVGGGTQSSGACIVTQAMMPHVQVIGVQAEQAPATYLGWKGEDTKNVEMDTFAEGIATRFTFELTQAILGRWLSDFVLVSEDAMRRAIITLLETTHNLAEGAGAAPLAAAEKIKDRLAGKTVALIISGGNLSMEQLRETLAAF
jgi:threonine dehydratase